VNPKKEAKSIVDWLFGKGITMRLRPKTKGEIQAELNRARETIAAQVKKIHNLESGHTLEFNRWQDEKARMKNVAESQDRHIQQLDSIRIQAGQRAQTFQRELRQAKTTIEQQKREIENLRQRRWALDKGASFVFDAPFVVPHSVAQERGLKEQALATARDFKARAERAERENKDKGDRIVNLLCEADAWKSEAQRERARADSMYHQRVVAEQRLAAALKPQIEVKALEMPSLMVDVRGFQEVKQTIEALKTERDSALRTADELRLKLDTVRGDRNRMIEMERAHARNEHYVGGGPVMGRNTLGRIEYLERAVESLRGTIVGGALPRRPA